MLNKELFKIMDKEIIINTCKYCLCALSYVCDCAFKKHSYCNSLSNVYEMTIDINGANFVVSSWLIWQIILLQCESLRVNCCIVMLQLAYTFTVSETLW